MSLVRMIARPLLASTLVYGGVDTYRNPAPRVPSAEKVVAVLPAKVPFIKDTEQVVKYDAAVKVVAAMLLATGRMPRSMAVALACSLVPTTLAGHRFWEESDPTKRKMQLLQLLKNASILGGLLLAAVDTAGRPSVGWRTRRAARSLSSTTTDQFVTAGDKLNSLTGRLRVG